MTLRAKNTEIHVAGYLPTHPLKDQGDFVSWTILKLPKIVGFLLCVVLKSQAHCTW